MTLLDLIRNRNEGNIRFYSHQLTREWVHIRFGIVIAVTTKSYRFGSNGLIKKWTFAFFVILVRYTSFRIFHLLQKTQINIFVIFLNYVKRLYSNLGDFRRKKTSASEHLVLRMPWIELLKPHFCINEMGFLHFLKSFCPHLTMGHDSLQNKFIIGGPWRIFIFVQVQGRGWFQAQEYTYVFRVLKSESDTDTLLKL